MASIDAHRDENVSLALLYLFLLLKICEEKYTVFFLKSVFSLRAQLGAQGHHNTTIKLNHRP
jgi:hypothetical protein